MSYKILKSALDGQAEARGSNILIYATSNRRGLIKETWSEREGYMGDEVHRNEVFKNKVTLGTFRNQFKASSPPLKMNI